MMHHLALKFSNNIMMYILGTCTHTHRCQHLILLMGKWINANKLTSPGQVQAYTQITNDHIEWVIRKIL